MTIEKTLADRGKTYGPFLEKAKTVQALIDVVIHEPGWERLAADQKQCIMVCFDKFARAIHGDPNHRDNFHDVVGYAKLVDDRMAADEAAKTETIADLAEAGWKVWTGGERPCGDRDTHYDVKLRDGDEVFSVTISDPSWRHIYDKADIIAYRLSSAPRT